MVVESGATDKIKVDMNCTVVAVNLSGRIRCYKVSQDVGGEVFNVSPLWMTPASKRKIVQQDTATTTWDQVYCGFMITKA